MALKHGLLGLLDYGSMTGYDLNKVFKESLNMFWQAQTSQIYRELNAMEKAGWLTSSQVIQTDKPNKKIYSITSAGRDELEKWVAQDETCSLFQVRSEFLMRLFFSGIRTAPEIVAMLKEQQCICRQKIAEIEGTGETISRQKKKTLQPAASLYWGLTAMYGAMYYQMTLAFLGRAIQILEEENGSTGN